jgi:hypothetical protein
MAEVRWIRTMVAVRKIEREALAAAGAKETRVSNLNPASKGAHVPHSTPASEHEKLRRVLMGMMGWKA